MAEAILEKINRVGADGISTKITYTSAGTFNDPNYELTVPVVLSATTYNYSFNELGTGSTTPNSVLQQSTPFTGWIEITTNLVDE